MAVSVFLDEEFEMPLNLTSLAEFRTWATGDDFPDRGRIDYIAGRIEVDMSPDDLICHGALKVELVRVLSHRVKTHRLGHLFTDRTRVSSPRGDLSAEPDLLFVSRETRLSGGVRYVPKASGSVGRYVELEGAPDLIVEIVSDRSVTKDTQRLPGAYSKAGVSEYWLADARGKEVLFQIHVLTEKGYKPASPDADNFQASAVMGCRFKLDALRDEFGDWQFDLREREVPAKGEQES